MLGAAGPASLKATWRSSMLHTVLRSPSPAAQMNSSNDLSPSWPSMKVLNLVRASLNECCAVPRTYAGFALRPTLPPNFCKSDTVIFRGSMLSREGMCGFQRARLTSFVTSQPACSDLSLRHGHTIRKTFLPNLNTLFINGSFGTLAASSLASRISLRFLCAAFSFATAIASCSSSVISFFLFFFTALPSAPSPPAPPSSGATLLLPILPFAFNFFFFFSHLTSILPAAMSSSRASCTRFRSERILARCCLRWNLSSIEPRSIPYIFSALTLSISACPELTSINDMRALPIPFSRWNACSFTICLLRLVAGPLTLRSSRSSHGNGIGSPSVLANFSESAMAGFMVLRYLGVSSS
mmetsp:Transcript_19298/g.50623  ORF Transcript_19298/g.50623 Transcript_19298/m.50623 type:complete len:354 (-) Transcript_19298:1131-2192(-)